MKHRVTILASLLLCIAHSALADEAESFTSDNWVEVSGNGVHRFSSAVIHSVVETDVGFEQRSTEIVELNGDLNGLILYHPISRFNFVEGTLTNSGDQVFSGSILDLGPVLLHDEKYRFDVNLDTGHTTGKVFLDNRLTGPDVRCQLDVVGDGQMDEMGDALFEYTGFCRIRQRPRPPCAPLIRTPRNH